MLLISSDLPTNKQISVIKINNIQLTIKLRQVIINNYYKVIGIEHFQVLQQIQIFNWNRKLTYMQTIPTQYLFFIDPTCLQQKLHQILTSLQSQNKQIKKYYSCKIQQIERQLQYKQKQLCQANLSLEGLQKKNQELEWKILEKDNIIEDLNYKVKNIQAVFKEKLHRFIDKVDFGMQDNDNISGNRQVGKRVNISQYFIKALQCSKSTNKIQNASTKEDNESPSQSSYNTTPYRFGNCLKSDSDPIGVYNRANPKLQKVKSLGQQKLVNEIQLSGYRDKDFIVSASKYQYTSKNKIKLSQANQQQKDRQIRQTIKVNTKSNNSNNIKVIKNQFGIGSGIQLEKQQKKEKNRKAKLMEFREKQVILFQQRKAQRNRMLQTK